MTGADGFTPSCPRLPATGRSLSLNEPAFIIGRNMGSKRGLCGFTMITINQLADMVAEIAGIPITKKHVTVPQGVRGRNSDNMRLRQVLGWKPEISLEEGLARTYAWIEMQVRECRTANSQHSAIGER